MTSAPTPPPSRRGKVLSRFGLRAAAGTVVLATAISLSTGVASGSASLAADPTATPTPTPTPTTPTSTTTPPAAAVPTVRMVQANLDSPQSVAHFQADVRTVMAQHPDFITYNEVAYRNDAVLAPGTYDLWRTPGKYTGETAVAWDASQWTPLAHGTWMVSDRRGRLPGQQVELGVRYANWVTLRNTLGQTVSVVSAHTAPPAANTEGLLIPSVRRIGALVASLSRSGPVVVGGDFNVGYRSSDYPRAELTQAGLTPTYDVLGRAPATGDHHGATIDYAFLHSPAQFSITGQYTRELYSDHDLLGIDLQLGGTVAGVFVPGVVWSNPRTAPRAAVLPVIKALDKAPAGSSVHLASRSLSGPPLIRAIVRAHKRGVYVQLLTADRRKTKVERAFTRMLGGRVKHKQWAINVTGRAWRRAGLPAAGLLASVSGGTPAVRIDVNRRLTIASQRAPMRAQISTSKAAYDPLFVRFFRAVGRQV